MWMVKIRLLFAAPLLMVSLTEAGKNLELPLRAEKLSDRVLFIKTGRSSTMSNVTAIAGEKGLVVIDAHYKPEYGKQIRHVVEDSFKRNDFNYLIYTHAGVDHMGGAGAFDDAVLIAQENAVTRINELHENMRTRDIKEALAPRLHYLQERLADAHADAAEKTKLEESFQYWSELGDLMASDFTYPEPDITFSDDLTLSLGDVTVELRFRFPGYSDSDIFIHVPEEKLLVVGDSFNKDRIPLLSEKSNVSRLDTYLEPFVTGTVELRHIVGCHDEPMTLSELKMQLAYIHDLWAEVAEAKKEGLTLEQTKERLAFDERFPELRHLNIRFAATPLNLHEHNIEQLYNR
jgi:glyoxylase-like metal-dependent hydrolase (beta-lactamase superfamily II)